MMTLLVLVMTQVGIAQKKITARPISAKGVPSLSGVFKKYSLFSINTPEITNYARQKKNAVVDIDLVFPGLSTMKLSLNENNLLDNNYQLTVATSQGDQVSGKPSCYTYAGTLTNDKNSKVYLTLTDKTIYGFIKGNGREYFIEPLSYFNKRAPGSSFVLYEKKDVVPYSGIMCAASEAAQKIKQSALAPAARNTATGTCKLVRIAIASDASMLAKYEAPMYVEAHNIGVVNTMVGIYSDAQLGTQYLNFSIAGQYIAATTLNDPLLPAYDGTDASTILTNFSQWGQSGRFRFPYDLGQFWTAKDFAVDGNFGVIGLAWLGAICTPNRYQVLEDLSSLSGLQLGILAAHETGHNFGAVHDASPLYIMAPSLANPPATTFSAESLTAMSTYLSSVTCLSTCYSTPMVASFTLPKAVCGLGPITLTRESVGESGVSFWDIPGGDPTSSNLPTQTVTYATPGLKTVTLTTVNPVSTKITVREILVDNPVTTGCKTLYPGNGQLTTIQSFRLGDIIHNEQYVYIGAKYTDYSCTSITGLMADSVYTVTAAVGLNRFGQNYNNRLQVFIDYNDDGDFTDAGESIYASAACTQESFTFSFTAPSAPVMNRLLRLRVIAMPCDMPESDGCSIPNNAQIEDYGVFVQGPAYLYYVDADGDGLGSDSKVWLHVATAPRGLSANNYDCNDQVPSILVRWVKDQDADGFYEGNILTQCTSPGTGYKIFAAQLPGDCDDNNPQLNPATVWLKDADNDGYSDGLRATQCTQPEGYKLVELIKPGLDCNDDDALLNPATVWVLDNDGDGYYPGNPVISCASPGGGYITNTDKQAGDCNDGDAALNPATVWYQDADNDGYSDGVTLIQCAQPTGYKLATDLTATGGDCDDTNAAINPATSWVLDNDGDGYYPGSPVISCTSPGNSYLIKATQLAGDCDDNNAVLNPATIWYEDRDNDGYSNLYTVSGCERPKIYYGGAFSLTFTYGKLAAELISLTQDCDDTRASINPGIVWYKDADNDGFSDGITQSACYRPLGYKLPTELSSGGDCDDNDSRLNPNTHWYPDVDNDGYSTGNYIVQCERPAGGKLPNELTATSGDCDDKNAILHPNTTWLKDADNDGYTDGTQIRQCTQPTGYKLPSALISGLDCNDADASLSPSTIWVTDADADGYYPGTPVIRCTSPGAGYIIKSTQLPGDCMDNNASVNPGAVEVCGNRIDDNCNGIIDEATCYPCQNATNLKTTSITSTGAQLNWSAIANPVLWQVQYKTTKQGSKWVDVLLTGNKRSVTITGLLSNQNYQWQIRAKCGSVWTAYSTAVGFKTLGAANLFVKPAPVVEKTIDLVGNTFKVHPNPTTGLVNLDLQLEQQTSEAAVITVLDITGRTVYTDKAALIKGVLRKNIQLPASAISGMYMVEIIVNGKPYTSKIVLMR